MNQLSHEKRAEEQAPHSDAAKAPDLHPTVLIVDDDPGILGALKRVLHNEPYNLLTTTSPMEAFHLLSTHSVQMVISDQRMPEMTGTELLLQVKLLYPDVVRVILTGYTDEEAIMAAINDGQVYKFLFKPWNAEALKLELYHALKYHAALASSRENQECHQVLNQLPAPIVVVNASDGIVRFNNAAAELFTALQTALPGQSSHERLPTDVLDALAAARQSGQPSWYTDIRHREMRFRMNGTQLAPGPTGSNWILLFQPLDLPDGRCLQIDTEAPPSKG